MKGKIKDTTKDHYNKTGKLLKIARYKAVNKAMLLTWFLIGSKLKLYIVSTISVNVEVATVSFPSSHTGQ